MPSHTSTYALRQRAAAGHPHPWNTHHQSLASGCCHGATCCMKCCALIPANVGVPAHSNASSAHKRGLTFDLQHTLPPEPDNIHFGPVVPDNASMPGVKCGNLSLVVNKLHLCPTCSGVHSSKQQHPVQNAAPYTLLYMHPEKSRPHKHSSYAGKAVLSRASTTRCPAQHTGQSIACSAILTQCKSGGACCSTQE